MEFEKEETAKSMNISRESLFSSVPSKLKVGKRSKLENDGFNEFYADLKRDGHPTYMNWMSKEFWKIVYKSVVNKNKVTKADILKVLFKEILGIAIFSVFLSFLAVILMGSATGGFLLLLGVLFTAFSLSYAICIPVILLALFKKYKRFYGEDSVQIESMVTNFFVEKTMKQKGLDFIKTSIPGE